MEIYLYDKNKKLAGKQNAQIDPLETKLAGHTVYCYPSNSTTKIPPEQKDGFDIVWNGASWEYAEMPKEQSKQEQEPHIQSEQEKVQAQINGLKMQLAETDYRAIKYAEGYYTEEEYAPYKKQRQEWRDEINKLEKQLQK